MDESIHDVQQVAAIKKSRPTFLKKKLFWITTAFILAVVSLLVAARSGKRGPFYETRLVERAIVMQTVEVTGEVKPEARLNLGFKSGGTLESLRVKVGQRVKAGELLAALESRDLRFAAERARATFAIAQANLDLRIAGETKESIAIAQAQVEQAEAAYDKALIDLDNTRRLVEDDFRVSEIAVKTAADNLNNAEASTLQSVSSSFSNLKSVLQSALGPMRTGLIDGDTVIGVDNVSANDDYEAVLGIADSASLNLSRQTYQTAKTSVTAAETSIHALPLDASHDSILPAAESARTALTDVQLYLTYVERVLSATITNVNLTSAELDTLRSTIAGNRASVSTQLISVVDSLEAAESARLTRQTTLDQMRNALESAQTNLRSAEFNRTAKVRLAENTVATQAAALSSAQATLAMRQVKPRTVDLSALRASVLDAQTAYAQARERLNDARIAARVDGIITDIAPNVGEQVAAGTTAIKMISDKGFTLEALVPEADIVKVTPGQEVEITLDAFGDDVKFAGKVISENPDQTKVSDAIYYKIFTTLDEVERELKSGMTANLTITTGKRGNVLVIPARALRERDDKRYVRVLLDKRAKEIAVELGLRGDEGKTEVVSGLSEGQVVIVSEVSAEEFGKLETEAKIGN